MDISSPSLVVGVVGAGLLLVVAVVFAWMAAKYRQKLISTEKAMAELATVVEAVEAGILTIRSDGRANNLNSAARDIVGNAPIDVARPFLDRAGIKVYAVRDISEAILDDSVEALVHELREGVATGEDLDKLLALTCQRIKNIFGFPLVWVTTVENDGRLPVRAAAGAEISEIVSLIGGPFPLTVAASRIRRSQITTKGEGRGSGLEALWRRGMSSLLAMPIIIGRTVLGVLHVASVGEVIEKEALQRLDQFALRLGIVINMGVVQSLMRLQSAAMNASASAVMISDSEGRIAWVNPAFCRLTGYSASEATALNQTEFDSIDATPVDVRRKNHALSNGQAWHGEMIGKRKDGGLYSAEQTITPIRDRQGRISHMVTVREDISAHKAAEERIHYLANFDTLTGLPNRRLFSEKLAEVIAKIEGSERMLAVFLLDLASFSRVNDTLGHEVGDRILVEIVRRLKGVVADSGILARVGGDEFAIVLNDAKDEEEAARLGKMLVAAIADPFLIDGHEVTIGSHVGVAIYPPDGVTADELLRNADMAMYQAVNRGQDEVCLFSSSMDTAARERLTIERDLRRAISDNEMFLLYQPQIEASTRRIVGFEALIRWNHPQLGIVSPDRFIPAAEETGLILPIGEWVLREACQFARRLKERGEKDAVIAINLSAVQFASKDLVDMVERILEECGIDSSAIELELTESTVMRDADAAIAMLTRLNRIGIGLAIDDFGTGHSSLNYLNMFPVGKIKIDKSFVQDIELNVSAADLARAIINLGHSMQFKTVSEGVETKAQYDHLRAEGCGIIQGFLFSRPVPADEAARMLAEQPFQNQG
jgi:diguanylate cyclase (GGDEF)-like protein/PAS domain S-box-containing protein